MVAQHREHAECQWLVPLGVVRLADCTLYVSECSREYNEGTGTVLDPRRPRRQAGRVPGSGVERAPWETAPRQQAAPPYLVS